MPKIKLGDEFKTDDLDVEYNEDGGYQEYEGEIPPRGAILAGRVKRVWYTISSNDNPMLKVIWEAEGNKGDSKKFDGLGIFDNVTFTPKAAFRYMPFLKLFGVTLADVKNKMIGGEEDNMGNPVEKIGSWSIDSDRSRCNVLIKREKYDGEIQARVAKYMPFDGKGGKGGKAAGAANGKLPEADAAEAAGGKKKKKKAKSGKDRPF